MARRAPVHFGLSWFDKRTEELVGESPLDLTARELRRLLHLPPRSSLHASFPVSPQHASALSALVHHPLDFDQFDYFVEASSTPVPIHAAAIQ